MRFGSRARLQAVFEDVFPERHIYVRSGGDMRAVVLTTGKQTFVAFLGALCALWMGVCSTAMLINFMSAGGGDQEAVKIRSYYERLIADRQARLNSAITQLSDNSGGVEQLASDVEKRNAALAMVIIDSNDAPVRPGAFRNGIQRRPQIDDADVQVLTPRARGTQHATQPQRAGVCIGQHHVERDHLALHSDVGVLPRREVLDRHVARLGGRRYRVKLLSRHVGDLLLLGCNGPRLRRAGRSGMLTASQNEGKEESGDEGK